MCYILSDIYYRYIYREPLAYLKIYVANSRESDSTSWTWQLTLLILALGS